MRIIANFWELEWRMWGWNKYRVFCQRCNVCLTHISPDHSSLTLQLDNMDRSSLHKKVTGTTGPFCTSQGYRGERKSHMHFWVAIHWLISLTTAGVQPLLCWSRERCLPPTCSIIKPQKRVTLGPVPLGVFNGTGRSFDFLSFTWTRNWDDNVSDFTMRHTQKSSLLTDLPRPNHVIPNTNCVTSNKLLNLYNI